MRRWLVGIGVLASFMAGVVYFLYDTSPISRLPLRVAPLYAALAFALFLFGVAWWLFLERPAIPPAPGPTPPPAGPPAPPAPPGRPAWRASFVWCVAGLIGFALIALAVYALKEWVGILLIWGRVMLWVVLAISVLLVLDRLRRPRTDAAGALHRRGWLTRVGLWMVALVIFLFLASELTSLIASFATGMQPFTARGFTRYLVEQDFRRGREYELGAGTLPPRISTHEYCRDRNRANGIRHQQELAGLLASHRAGTFSGEDAKAEALLLSRLAAYSRDYWACEEQISRAQAIDSAHLKKSSFFSFFTPVAEALWPPPTPQAPPGAQLLRVSLKGPDTWVRVSWSPCPGCPYTFHALGRTTFGSCGSVPCPLVQGYDGSTFSIPSDPKKCLRLSFEPKAFLGLDGYIDLLRWPAGTAMPPGTEDCAPSDPIPPSMVPPGASG